jgi:cholesterol transport system auxiliary component
MKKNTILAFVLLSEMFILGCNPGGGPGGQRRYFLLDLQREGQKLNEPQKDVVLMVRPFTLSPGYNAKELTYRKSEFQYESDYYNQFITDVGQQVAEQTRKWLSQSGYFAHLVTPGSTMSATYILEGNITRLYGDFRDKSNAKAFMSITFYLIDITNRKPNVVLSDSIYTQNPIKEATAESLIKAYQDCLHEILENLEKKLTQINLTT